MKIVNREVVEARIRQLYDTSKFRIGVVTTGAGAGIGNLLWQTAGASSTLTGVQLPYHRHEVEQAALGSVAKYLSFGCAHQLATTAFLRAQQCAMEDFSAGISRAPIGLGVSAAVQTTRERRGMDEIFLAVRTMRGSFQAHVVLKKGVARRLQGEVCDVLGLNALLAVTGLTQLPMKESSTWLWQENCAAGAETTILQLEPANPPQITSDLMLFDEGGQEIQLNPAELVAFPGSFNPYHFGHDAVAAQIERFTGRKVVRVVSESNLVKGHASDAADRLVQLRGRLAGIERNAPRFVEKARKFGFRRFIVGADIADKILAPKSYPQGGIAEALGTLRTLGVKFYVVPRQSEDAAVSWDRAPDNVADLFTPVLGRFDISSTKLRALEARIGHQRL